MEIGDGVEAHPEGNLLARQFLPEQQFLAQGQLQTEEIIAGREARVVLELLAELGVAHADGVGDVGRTDALAELLGAKVQGDDGEIYTHEGVQWE